MATTNTSIGTASDALTRAANPGDFLVNPLSGRELRREADRRRQREFRQSRTARKSNNRGMG